MSFYSGLNEKVEGSALKIGKAKLFFESIFKPTPLNAMGVSGRENKDFDSFLSGSKRFLE